MPLSDTLCCDRPMYDFSYHRLFDLSDTKVNHLFCCKCGKHLHEDKWYTKEEWFFYINGITHQQYQEQCKMEEESAHLHETINHSNPESLSE